MPVYMGEMRRTEAVTQLKLATDAIAGMGATALYLYGSASRNEARSDSDLDIYVDYDPASKFNALDLVGIKLMLEEKLGVPIDLTKADGLHPRLKPEIIKNAIRIF